jgi:hypothetical protein
MSLLWIIAVVLIIIWVLGLIFKILGAFIHVLLILAIIAAVIGFLQRS